MTYRPSTANDVQILLENVNYRYRDVQFRVVLDSDYLKAENTQNRNQSNTHDCTMIVVARI
jgi:hypothetical protein